MMKKMLAVLLLFVTTSAFGQYPGFTQDRILMRNYSPANAATINTVLSQLSSSRGYTLVFETPWSIDRDVTFPVNVYVDITPGGYFMGYGSPTVTFLGGMQDGYYPRFYGAIKVAGLAEARPCWWQWDGTNQSIYSITNVDASRRLLTLGDLNDTAWYITAAADNVNMGGNSITNVQSLLVGAIRLGTETRTTWPGGGDGTFRFQQVLEDGTVLDTYSSVTNLQVDYDSGLHLTSATPGTVKLFVGSHWYGIGAAGETNYPTGAQDINFATSTNVTDITWNTNTDPWTLTWPSGFTPIGLIDDEGTTNFINSGDTVRFTTQNSDTTYIVKTGSVVNVIGCRPSGYADRIYVLASDGSVLTNINFEWNDVITFGICDGDAIIVSNDAVLFPRGLQGERGYPGHEFAYAGPWQPGEYTTNMGATYGGAYYGCLSNATYASPPTNYLSSGEWVTLAKGSDGADGTDGSDLLWYGDWSASRNYDSPGIVRRAGYGAYAWAETSSNAPPEDTPTKWTVFNLDGSDGASGVVISNAFMAGSFNYALNYVSNAVVSYDFGSSYSIYRCIQDRTFENNIGTGGTPLQDTAFWQLLLSASDGSAGAPGTDGTDGAGNLWFEDEYQSDKEYTNAGTVVVYGDLTYISISNSTGVIPGTTLGWSNSWRQASSRGRDGGNWDFQIGWSSGTVYSNDAVVVVSNIFWKALQVVSAGQDAPWDDDGDNWERLIDPEYREYALLSTVAWESGNTYTNNQVVRHDGSTWVVIAPATASAPSTGNVDYAPIALKGATGATGANGTNTVVYTNLTSNIWTTIHQPTNYISTNILTNITSGIVNEGTSNAVAIADGVLNLYVRTNYLSAATILGATNAIGGADFAYNPSTRTLTIQTNASGGAGAASLDDLSDVSTVGLTPSNILWSADGATWQVAEVIVATAGSGGSTAGIAEIPLNGSSALDWGVLNGSMSRVTSNGYSCLDADNDIFGYTDSLPIYSATGLRVSTNYFGCWAASNATYGILQQLSSDNGSTWTAVTNSISATTNATVFGLSSITSTAGRVLYRVGVATNASANTLFIYQIDPRGAL